jgi:hypothetical protein
MHTKKYTFQIYCTFKMQYTFTGDEVQQDPDGDATDLEPKDEALNALQRELEEYLAENYPVSQVDASADSSAFLGMDEEPG